MNDPREDVELLEGWRVGDDDAGNVLVRRHFDALFRFFRARLDDGVADLVQRTFLGAVEARERLPPAGFRSYLFGIAHKQLLMELRKRSRRRDLPGSVDGASPVSGGSPSALLLQHQEQHLLLRALRRIPLELQLVLQLHYWDEVPTAEIGEILGIPAGTVKSRLFRARSLVKESIAALAQDSATTTSTLSNLDAWARSLRDAFGRGGG